MQYRRIITFMLTTLAMLAFSACTSVAVPVRTISQVQLEWVDDTKLGAPMQDVYVETDDPDMVVRFQAEDLEDPEFLQQATYRSTTANAPDLSMSGPNPLGPFPKGEALPFTVGEWLAATGSGVYTLDGDIARMDFTFQNLVPNSVYTMWCMTTNAETGGMIEFPCGAPDGSESIFQTDAEGMGRYTLTLPPLPEKTDTNTTALAIAYHSDGLTHGESPGDYGKNVHIPLSTAIPASDDPAWQQFMIVGH